MSKTNMHQFNQVAVGFKDGRTIYVSETAIAQYGMESVRESLGLTCEFPVKTGFGEHDVVMVKANTHEEAVEKYLRRRS